MPFEFKSGERKHPKEFGGSPFKFLIAEVGNFAGQHRKHSLRRFAGLDGEEEQEHSPSEMVGKSMEECEACAKGECDDPEHMSEDERGAMETMLGESAE